MIFVIAIREFFFNEIITSLKLKSSSVTRIFTIDKLNPGSPVTVLILQGILARVIRTLLSRDFSYATSDVSKSGFSKANVALAVVLGMVLQSSSIDLISLPR